MTDISDRPTKRARMTPESEEQPAFDNNADYISLGQDTGSVTNGSTQAPRRHDPRSASDRPRTKHILPGYEPWILVRTRLGQRFVHNTQTKQSYWKIPGNVRAGVEAYDEQEEKQKNAQWAEEQLREMRLKASASMPKATSTAAPDDRSRRRRSESLQREDEQAMMAELAAGDAGEEAPVPGAKADVQARGYLGEASDSEYEYVEVTDSEGEHDAEDDSDGLIPDATREDTIPEQQADVEFGEDDIAYQLAMMGESYGLDPEEYGVQDLADGDQLDDNDQATQLTNDEASALFFQMLDESNISPFTPWDKVITDNTASSIVLDDRFTLLPSSKLRKEAWGRWSSQRATQLQQQRAEQQKDRSPRVEFLAFLAQHAADGKLYWPEFKRKFKGASELDRRALVDGDRQKLYREFVAKVKMPMEKRVLEMFAGTKRADPAAREVPVKVQGMPVYWAVPEVIRNEKWKERGYDIS